MPIAVQVGKIEQRVVDSAEKLDAIHRSLKDDISQVESRLTEKLEKVEKQTTLTNGRVTAGETRHAELKGIALALGGASPFLVALVAYGLAKVFG